MRATVPTRPRRLGVAVAVLGAVLGAVLLTMAAGCSATADRAATEPRGESPSAPPSAAPASAAPSSAAPPPLLPTPGRAVTRDPALRRELLAMQRCDQGDCTSEQERLGQAGREQRLDEILGEHGWPTWPLVGRAGEDAAWLIAQHADLDPDLQRRALDLLRAAVGAGVASAGNLAYLDDRVAVAEGRPQTYGTQIRCGADGTPSPATPIADEAGVEARRAGVGIEPLSAYLVEMTSVCAAD